MKKGIKWMMILSIVFCLLGIGVITAGAMMGGGYYLKQTLKVADRWDGVILEKPGSMEFPLEEARQYENIRKLKADVDGIVFFQESEELGEGQIMIAKADGGEDYEYSQEGDTLKIDLPWSSRRNRESFENRIMIMVPTGYPLDAIDIEVAAGVFQAETMEAGEISLQVKAGTIEVEQANVDKLKLESDAGWIQCRADVAREVSVDSDIGEILLALKGEKEDFDYELECAAGSIVLMDSESEEYQGLHYEKNLDYGAEKKAELECSAGSITVSYWK